MSKRTFVGGGQVRKNSLNPYKIRKNDIINNIIFKDVKEFNIIFLILIGIFLVSISGYSSYAIFSDEIISNNEIKGTVVQKNAKPNPPLLSENMIPVYYDESNSVWRKADINNTNNSWYDYDSKKWANAVTLEKDGGDTEFTYSKKSESNKTVSLGSSQCDLNIMNSLDESTAITFYLPNTKEDSQIQTSEYTNVKYSDFYFITNYDYSCGYDFNGDSSKQTLYQLNKSHEITIKKIISNYISSGGMTVWTPIDNRAFYFASVTENDDVEVTAYEIKEITSYNKYKFSTSYTFDTKTGKYTLGTTTDSEITSAIIGKYTCVGGTTCTTLYKVNAVSNHKITNADVYTSNKVATKNKELILADGSKKTCTNNACTREDYVGAPNGTVIPLYDINAMFVWIPRYKYTYFSSSTPVEIPIKFEKGTASTGTIKCTDAIAASSKKSENCTDAVNGSLTVGKSTYTHPAFTFGEDELTGIWVGKFESTGTKIKPDLIPGDYGINTLFELSRKMELANNIYGFPQTSSALNKVTGEISGDSNNLDTHIVKNMEWGAAAYFSHSKYGTCTNGSCQEIGINNYNGLSGCGSESSSNSSTTCNKYNTTEGMKASTTRNIYGIYDMSGGAYEYVMGNMQDENNKFYPESVGTWGATNTPLNKYYDKYSYDESGYGSEYSYGKLGDATLELQPDDLSYITWYDDYALIFTTGYPWLFRGGQCDESSNAGLFYFMSDAGAGALGSRVVLAITNS